MSYQLRPGLSFGFIGDRAVLLDLNVDRYFLLTATTAQALRDIVAENVDFEKCQRLPRPGGQPLLVEGNEKIEPVDAVLPNMSVLEAGEGAITAFRFRRVFAAQIYASASLRFLSLKRTIENWRRSRPTGVNRLITTETIELAQSFAAHRPMVPIRRSCVPDSLALIRLLWREGFDADLYFGVRLEPFAAHCWVQAEDCLLSDPVAYVLDFTPVFKL